MVSVKKIFALLLVSCTLIFSAPVMAAGQIDFNQFKMLGSPPNYQVQTRVEFTLTDYLREALLNGVALNARVQFRLGQHRSWWFNKDNPLLTIQFQLKYHALSRRFLLLRNDTGEQWNFASLSEAIGKLGELRRYTLPQLPNIKEEQGYYILAVADLSPSTLKLPLRLQSFFSDEYSINSEGVFWPLP